MKPLNSEERTKQFLIFLAFFTATMALVIVTVYFNAINNPKYHNEALRKDKKKIEEQLKLDEMYLTKIDAFISNLDAAKALGGIQLDTKCKQISDKVLDDYHFAANDTDSKIIKLYNLQLFTLAFFNDIKVMKDNLDKMKTKYNGLVDNYNNLTMQLAPGVQPPPREIKEN